MEADGKQMEADGSRWEADRRRSKEIEGDGRRYGVRDIDRDGTIDREKFSLT